MKNTLHNNLVIRALSELINGIHDEQSYLDVQKHIIYAYLNDEIEHGTEQFLLSIAERRLNERSNLKG
ncbi:MAG: hypothetical protein HUJ98_13110 [Bacteroidaceae bacterium]|nr:hypothetical protein [Bacteroidaceae bacterium]